MSGLIINPAEAQVPADISADTKPSSPAVFVKDRKVGALSKMFTDGHAASIVEGIEKAVRHSFVSNGMQNATVDEARRRSAICFELIRMLRGDLQWGVVRIMDSLPRLLVDSLNGVDFNPDAERACWMPSDGVAP